MSDITLTLVGSAITVIAGFTWYKLARANTLKDRALDEKIKQKDELTDKKLERVKVLKKHKVFLVETKNEFGVSLIVKTLESSNPTSYFNSKLSPIKKGISSLTVLAEQDAPKLTEEVTRLTKYIGNVETLMQEAITRKVSGEHSFDKGPLNEAVHNCQAACHRLKVDIDTMLSELST